MKAYSQDMREQVVKAVEQGVEYKQIVRVMGVSLATIGRYIKQYRETGQVRAKAIPGRPSKKIVPLQAGLAAQVQLYPDATLAQHAQYWQQSQGMQVSASSVGRALKRMRITRKKSHSEPRSRMKRHAGRG